MRRSRSLTLLAVLYAALGAALSGLWATESSAAPDTPSSPAVAAELLARVEALEALLGIEPGAHPYPTSVRHQYDELVARTERLAALGGNALARIPSIAPVEHPRITSPYTPQRMHPILRQVMPHFGLDFAAPTGSPIRATADGVVLAVSSTPTYGNTVDIDHGNGFITRYAHASRILVRVGDIVRRRDTIALVGSTGRSTGAHVHYEVFRDGWSIDPLPLLAERHITIGQRSAQ